MNKILKVLILLPAILFLVVGLRWLVDPAGVAPSFGLSLSQGLGLSSQVGDMAGFFLYHFYLYVDCCDRWPSYLVLSAGDVALYYSCRSHCGLAGTRRWSGDGTNCRGGYSLRAAPGCITSFTCGIVDFVFFAIESARFACTDSRLFDSLA